MNLIINPIERVIVLSLIQKDKTINELTIDTNLKFEYVFKSVQSLIVKNFIFYQDGSYFFHSDRINEIKEILENEENKKLDSAFILNSAINEAIENKNKESLSIRSIRLDSQDEKTLRFLFQQVESFLQSASQKNKNKKEDTQYNYIYWGKQSFNKLISQAVK